MPARLSPSSIGLFAGEKSYVDTLMQRAQESRTLRSQCGSSGRRTTRNVRNVGRALAVVEELPLQLEEALHEETVATVSGLQHAVEELCQLINVEGSDSAQQAVNEIGEIPSLVLSSLQSTVAEVKGLVEEQMDNFVMHHASDFNAMSSSSSHESLFRQMDGIPDQVGEIAQRVTDAGWENSRAKAAVQINRALQLSNDPAVLALAGQMQQKMPMKPLQSMGFVAEKVAKSNVQSAIESAQIQKSSRLNNHSVANIILLSKVLEEKPTSRCKLPNPGSAGHPELCKRPCLYFVAGQCANGTACGFCHLGHSGRVAHLDKRNREALKALPKELHFRVILEAMRSRVNDVDFADAANEFFDDLEHCLRSREGLSPAQEQKNLDFERDPTLKRLLLALQALPLSSMLSTMNRSVRSAADAAPIDARIEEGLEKLRTEMALDYWREAPSSFGGRSTMVPGCNDKYGAFSMPHSRRWHGTQSSRLSTNSSIAS
eukprot:CAMPEP_0197632348 /NCGR_PEP_ID=MMETSP1338-20131121/9144_1 /TAXON_ID=43686 ORGANISM="Pelagodinium beii, Strain RCC1491" /NCGR_SAMPLE_ID=MMETSP1338 /ASSEMBLY_ACC=CAM_ASM_000754 /LENGTH=487 /DNA_ID=CAMNT_0043203911 /DNA_START=72 /DNA_END=1535 /DNA_ORIENTATION=-